jgi:diguanylate cyclase (GGDEF)-like protein
MSRRLKALPDQMVNLRDTLVPVFVSAAIGAALVLALYETHAVLAAVSGVVGGSLVGVWLEHRGPVSALKGERNARIHELELELAAERALSASFKTEVEARDTETQRVLGDLEMNRAIIEEQASQSVGLAEDLAEQKLEIERSKQRSDYLANHDLLTGLPNRRAFQEELRQRVERASSDGQTIGLLFIDLDKFKEVNDTLGHDAGDDLLKTVSAILDAAMRDDDFAARLGGDEFAAIIEIPREHSRKVGFNVAERLRLALQIPIPSPKGEIGVGATIGVALHPHDATDAAELLHTADQVMYAGKRHGRNRVVMTEELSPEELKAANSH